MPIQNVSDMNGDVLNVGTHIRATLDKQEYTAVITGFERFQGNVLKVIAIRDDDKTEVTTFSDAVVRFKS
jgi:hypothetical protein